MSEDQIGFLAAFSDVTKGGQFTSIEVVCEFIVTYDVGPDSDQLD